MTEPDLRSGQPDEHHGAAADGAESPRHPWYANCVAGFDNAPTPQLLLAICLDVERDEGRVREPAARGSNGGPQPRTLDIDVLLVGNRVIDEPGLRVPHPRMSQRRFVLQPLAAIAADLIHPLSGLSIDAMLAALPQRERVTELDTQPSEAR
jgi:2-amino-4-hydroxy-6-hydroxymethyldihydropteridine diphosphokinase